MSRQNKMATMPMGRLVLDMSLPMMISLLIQSLYNIVDSIFVARISEHALTATSLAYPVQMLMISVGVGSAVGLNAVLSKALGAKKEQEASEIAATGVLLSVFWGLLFGIIGLLFAGRIAHAFTANAEIAEACQSYLWICMVFALGNIVCMTYQRLMQATGKTMLSMVILVAGAVTNLVLDPIMIFGLLGCPAMGIKGAAYATVIGQWVSMFVGFFLQARYNKDVHVTFKNFKLNMNHVLAIYKIGLPTIVTQAMQSMMVTCFNAILQPFSTTAVAFFGVYYKLQTFLFMPMNGLGQAAIPIAGYNFGARNKERIKEIVKVIYPAAIVLALCGTALFCILPKNLLSLFSASAEMLEIGVPAIRIIAPTFALASVTVISGYLASGLQDGVTNMLSAFIRQFVPLIPCAWLFGKSGGAGMVWYAFWIAEICGILFALLRIRSIFKQKVDTIQ